MHYFLEDYLGTLINWAPWRQPRLVKGAVNVKFLMKKIKIQKTLESCPKMFGMATLMAFSIFASKFHRTNRLQKTLIVLKSYLNLTLLLYNKSLNVCFLVK